MTYVLKYPCSSTSECAGIGYCGFDNSATDGYCTACDGSTSCSDQGLTAEGIAECENNCGGDVDDSTGSYYYYGYGSYYYDETTEAAPEEETTLPETTLPATTEPATTLDLTLSNLGTYPTWSSTPYTGSVDLRFFGTSVEISWDLKNVDEECSSGPVSGVANSCGVHIHSGTSCVHHDLAGGHYYAQDPDPWQIIGYTSSGSNAIETMTVNYGYDWAATEGKAFVIHNAAGARVTCALLGKTETVMTLNNAHGIITLGFVDTTVSIAYDLSGIDNACTSPQDGVANSCGIQIYSASSCDSQDGNGDHYYSSSLSEDPWTTSVWVVTDVESDVADGATQVDTGETYDSTLGRTLVVHDSNGDRASCSRLGICGDNVCDDLEMVTCQSDCPAEITNAVCDCVVSANLCRETCPAVVDLGADCAVYGIDAICGGIIDFDAVYYEICGECPKPTLNPTAGPSVEPSKEPSINPTLEPTFNPTMNPTPPDSCSFTGTQTVAIDDCDSNFWLTTSVQDLLALKPDNADWEICRIDNGDDVYEWGVIANDQVYRTCVQAGTVSTEVCHEDYVCNSDVVGTANAMSWAISGIVRDNYMHQDCPTIQAECSMPINWFYNELADYSGLDRTWLGNNVCVGEDYHVRVVTVGGVVNTCTSYRYDPGQAENYVCPVERSFLCGTMVRNGRQVFGWPAGQFQMAALALQQADYVHPDCGPLLTCC